MRNGMQIAEVENEGPLVLLYDAAHADAIGKSGAAILKGYAPGAADDPALKKLLDEGLIAIYELPQDDPIHLGVVAGDPLDAKEKKAAKWRKPQTAFLKLPSGKLRVDSYSTLDEKTGPVLEFPTGDYELTLHRIDVAAMQGKAFDGPNEIITLTPVKAPPKKRTPGFLEFESEPRAPWDGKGTLTKDGFQGELVRLSPKFPDGSLSINVTVGQARKVQWQSGTHLRIEIGGAKLEALFQGEMNPIQFDAFGDDAEIAALRAKHPALLRAWLDKADSDETRIPGGMWYRATKILRMCAFKGGGDAVRSTLPADFFGTAAGASATVRALAQPLLPAPDPRWQGRWKVDGGVLHAEVLLSKPDTIWLNADEAAFKKLGFKFEKGGELELTLGDQTRRVNDKSGTAGRTREEKEGQVPGAIDQKPLTIQFRPFLANPSLFTAACDAFFFKKYALDLPAKPGTPVTLKIKK